MPNPLIKAGPANTSHARDEIPLEPVPHHEAGRVNPYRGMEMHGVSPTVDPVEPPPVLDEGEHITYDAPVHEPEPVPVRIVTERSNERQLFRVIKEYATSDGGRKVFSGRHGIRSIRVCNLDASVTVWISDSPNPGPGFGFPIYAKSTLELDNSRDSTLYAISENGAQIGLAILIEYVTET